MQMLTVTNSNTLTMSSREIADLTGKRHDHVLRDIRNMLDEIQSPQNWGDYQDDRGRSQPMLLLSKEESLCLVAGYSAKLRFAIIKRWQELENKDSELSLPDFNNPIEAARAWADAKEAEQLAIATKAQINDKRTATIMGRLGNATKKIKALEDKLQDVGDYLSITAAKIPQRVDTQMRNNVQSWRLLKQLSSDMQLTPKKVKDQRYGEVLAYHVDVIDKFKDMYL